MIDFHNHILPNVDDGPLSMNESLEMLNSAVNQGITDVVNTVHFQHPKSNPEKVKYSNVIRVYNELLEKLSINKIDVNIHLASEVFFLPNLTKVKDNPLTIIGNRYMLIEFQTFSFPDNYEKNLYELTLKGITPIIAHPERYRKIQENTDKIIDFINKGYIIQMDAGSLLGYFGKKCKLTADRILENGMCHILGSDAHNSHKRNFCLQEAIDYSKDRIGEEALNLVTVNPQNILNGKQVDLVEVSTKKNKKFFLVDRLIKRFFKDK